jgi:hypothetical protein
VWLVGLLVSGIVLGLSVPARTQNQNLDAGKTPAQMFNDTCAACHKRPGEVRRPSASFLRQHYTTSSEEAQAMANYLSGVPAVDPRAGQQKRAPATATQSPADSAKQAPKQQPAGEAKTSQAQIKGRQPAAKSAAAAENRAPELPPETGPSEPPAAAAATVIEPFEE